MIMNSCSRLCVRDRSCHNGWTTFNSRTNLQLSCSGTDLHTSSSDQESALPLCILWSTKHCLSVLYYIFVFFGGGVPMEHQYSNWNTVCLMLPSLSCFFKISLVLSYVLWAAMLSLMQKKFTWFFVLQGDEQIMLHHFCNDSNTTFWCHCQCLIPLVCTKVITTINANKTKIWMASSLKIHLCIWTLDLFCFFH